MASIEFLERIKNKVADFSLMRALLQENIELKNQLGFDTLVGDNQVPPTFELHVFKNRNDQWQARVSFSDVKPDGRVVTEVFMVGDTLHLASLLRLAIVKLKDKYAEFHGKGQKEVQAR